MKKSDRKTIVKSLLNAASLLMSDSSVSAGKDSYVAVRELPPVVQKALKSVRYSGRDVRIVVTDKFSRDNNPFEGNRGYNVYVNLATNKFDSEMGSFGGPNMFEDRGGDSDTKLRSIPNNILVIKGERGGRGSFATIYVNSHTVAPLLPAPSDVSDDEKKALNVIGELKSSYRADEFQYKGLGAYNMSNPLIQSLISKGMLKTNKRGSIMITTKGKNAR